MKGHQLALKIALLTLGIYPIAAGGVQVHSFFHALGLRALGWQVSVYTRKCGGRSRTSVDGVVVEMLGSGVPILGQVAFILAALFRLMTARRSIRLVHVHYATYFALPAYLFSLITSKPFAVSCHGYDIIYLRRSPLWKSLQRLIFRRAAAVTATSNYVKRILEAEYGLGGGKVTLVPNGIDEKEIAEARRAAAARSERTVAFVANLRPVKDPITAARAFKIAAGRVPGLKLVVIGDGPLRNQMEAYIRENGLEKSIELKGSLSHAATLKNVAESSAFILSSLSEGGNPIALMEAMALEKPVVATAVGGVMDVIVDGVNGVAVPAGSPELLAEALVRVLEDAEYAGALSRNARLLSHSYGWARLISLYAETYERVLANP